MSRTDASSSRCCGLGTARCTRCWRSVRDHLQVEGVISFAQPALMLTGRVLVTYLVADRGLLPGVVAGRARGGRCSRSVVERWRCARWWASRCSSSRSSHRRRHRHPGGRRRLHRLGRPPDRGPVGAIGRLAVGVQVQRRHIAMLVTTMVLVSPRCSVFFRYTRIGTGDAGHRVRPGGGARAGRRRRQVFALSWVLAGASPLGGRFARHRHRGRPAAVDRRAARTARDHPRRARLAPGARWSAASSSVWPSRWSRTLPAGLAPWLGDNFARSSPYLSCWWCCWSGRTGCSGPRR